MLENWGDVGSVLTSNFVLLTDYDGTLTPIVQRPEDALIPSDVRDLLKRLAAVCPVGVVSGRALDDVKGMVGVDGIYYAGNHGFEIEGPGVKLTKPEAERSRPVIDEVCSEIKRRLENFDGMILEEKGPTASVHYRMVAEDRVQELKEIVDEVVGPKVESGELRVTRGKKVVELRPPIDWDKGRTVEWLTEVIGKERGEVYPISLGDDATDEDAFRALKGKGLSVLVAGGARKSEAEYLLRDVEEVKEFLGRLISAREK